MYSFLQQLIHRQARAARHRI